jgi:hypothetical protein
MEAITICQKPFNRPLPLAAAGCPPNEHYPILPRTNATGLNTQLLLQRPVQFNQNLSNKFQASPSAKQARSAKDKPSELCLSR